MGRTKNYDAHIANLNKEIAGAEKKLIGLQKQLDVIIHEKETSEANAIYRYVKANHISVKDFAKSFSGILNEQSAAKSTPKKSGDKSAKTSSSSSAKQKKSTVKNATSTSKKSAQKKTAETM